MDPRSAGAVPTARMVWLAMLSSVLIYAVVGFVLGRIGLLPLTARPPAFLTPGFALAGLALAGTAVVARRVLVTERTAATTSAPQLASLLVPWALCESIAVLGFVHHLLFARPAISGGLIGAALALLLLQPPR
jgi:hypothetical protein